MKPYKKRAQACWNSSKGNKEISNRKERHFGKQEIRQQQKEEELGDKFRYKWKIPAKPTKKSIENKIRNMEKRLEGYRIRNNGTWMYKLLISSFLKELNRLKKKLDDY